MTVRTYLVFVSSSDCDTYQTSNFTKSHNKTKSNSVVLSIVYHGPSYCLHSESLRKSRSNVVCVLFWLVLYLLSFLRIDSKHCSSGSYPSGPEHSWNCSCDPWVRESEKTRCQSRLSRNRLLQGNNSVLPTTGDLSFLLVSSLSLFLYRRLR